MIDAYCELIIEKFRTFGEVNPKYKAAVEARLRERGYDTNGDRITTEE